MTPELAPSASFNQTYANRLQLVEAGVERFCNQLCVEDADPITSEARKAFVTVFKGPGKRLRGVLTATGYELGRELYPGMEAPADETLIGDAAGMMEAVHAYILLFDDMADGASRRRDLPTVHTHLEAFLTERATGHLPGWRFLARKRAVQGIPERARSYTEIMGLIVKEQTHKALLGLPLPAESLVAASSILHDGLELTGYGQGRDMLPASLGSGREHAFQVAINKTSHYTFLPLQVGAALAGASPLSLLEFAGYTFNAGLAFQFRDDIISTFGDPAVTGKDAMSDIKEGNETILIALAREKANRRGLRVLQRALGNTALRPRNFARCLEVIENTGALQDTNDLVHRLTQQAIDAIPQHWPEQHRQFLRGVVLAGAQREK